MTDDERPPTPEETMRLIEEQRAAVAKRVVPDPLLFYVPWGGAWLLGFGALFLHYGLDGVGGGPVSLPQAMAVLYAGQIVAIVITGIASAKINRGMRGENPAKGAMYGYSWMAGLLLMWIIGFRFSYRLPEAEATLLWAGGFLMVVALLYMAGGAVWMSRPMFFLGVWAAAVNGAGLLLGVGWHALLTAVLLGAGLIVAGLWHRRRM